MKKEVPNMGVHEAIRRLKIAFCRIDDLYLKRAEQLGLKPKLFLLFYAIADGRVYSQKQICDDWSLPRTTLNTSVRECLRKGYVRMVPRGNKEKDILLTPAGRKIVERVFRPIFKAESLAMKPLLGDGLLEAVEAMADRFEKVFHGAK